jgi:glutathione S-transferase
MIEIYGHGATRSMRALWAAKEAGLEFNYIDVDLKEGHHFSEDFKKLNPFCRIPAFKDGDYVLWESAAIITYLGDLVPEKGLVPQEAKERGLYNKWLHFANTEIDAPLFTIEKHIWRYPEYERDPKVAKKALDELQAPLKVVTEHLGDNEYLMGETFTMADILMAHCLNWARYREAFNDNNILNDYTKKLSKRECYPRELYRKS